MPPLLQVADVHASYGRVEVLHGLSFSVPEGSVVALLGANGVGKTTALRAISGTLPPTHGSIRLAGRRIDGRRPDEIARRGLVLVPEGRGIFPALTVAENMRLAHAAVSAAPPWNTWLEDTTGVFPRLGERMEQTAGSLSGGEQQMLALCRVLAGEPRLVMFDELSMGLAPLIVEQLFDLVAQLRDRGRTILLVEQYLSHALRLADVCYVLARGRVVFAGEPAELRNGKAAAEYLAR
jgi:branched-chain amino acid transport system ATP-binding protein